MAYSLTHVQRLRVAQESSFASDLSGSIGNFRDVHFITAEFMPGQEMLADEGMVQGSYYHRNDQAGRKMPTMDASGYLVSTGNALGDGASAPSAADWGLGTILETMFGGYNAAAGSVESGTPAVDTIDADTGEGSNWVEGTVVGVTNGNGKFEVRPVASVSSDELTLAYNLSAAPSGGAELFHSHQFWFAEDPSDSLQFIIEKGSDRDNVHWMMGAMPSSFSLELSPNALARWSATFMGADWEHDNDVATPVGSGALGVGTLAGGEPIPFVDTCLNFTTNSSPSLNHLEAQEIALNLGFAYEAYESTCGVNGVGRMILVPQRPMITGSFVIPADSSKGSYYDIETLEDLRDNETAMRWSLQLGAQGPTQTYFFDCEKVYISNVEPAETQSLHGIRVSWYAVHPQTTNAFLASPLRVFAL